MLEPHDLGLPPAIRAWTPGQWDAITKIAIREERYIIVEAPTGSGKSVVAIAVANLLDAARTVIVTGTKQLQDQYAETFPTLVTARGRNNFPCILDGETCNADQAVCTIGFSCPHKKAEQDEEGRHIGPPECPYYAQRWIAERSSLAAVNYSYWLHCANYSHTFTHPDILIFDEAHLLDDEVRRFATIPARLSWFAMTGIDTPVFPDAIDPWRLWAEAESMKLGLLREMVKRKNPYDLTRAERQYRAAVMGLSELCRMLLREDHVDDESWIIQGYHWGWEFKPVWVDGLTPELVLKHVGRRAIFMSATILGKEMFCKNLGIPPEETALIQIPSTFPRERRPLFFNPVTKVKARDQQSLRLLTKEIDRVLGKHVGQRGLVHTNSYEIAQYVCENSRHRGRLVTHRSSGERSGALEKYKKTEGAVLVSPSVGTGVDLPYDLVRFQIIAKLPFPNQADPQVRRRMKEQAPGVPNEKGQSWYNWITACALVQAYGRGVRAVDDACVTYLLDGNYTWWKHTVREMMPVWFLEAIRYQPTASYTEEDILRQIRGE